MRRWTSKRRWRNSVRLLRKSTGFRIGPSSVDLILRTTCSKTSRKNSDVVRFYRVKDRKLVSISGWIKTPDGERMVSIETLQVGDRFVVRLDLTS